MQCITGLRVLSNVDTDRYRFDQHRLTYKVYSVHILKRAVDSVDFICRFHWSCQSMCVSLHNDRGIVKLIQCIPECVAVSINICPWQDPMQFGIKIAGTPCGTPGYRRDVSYVQMNEIFPPNT